MTRNEAIEILKRHNQWRRGAEIPMESPKDIGEAIDILVNAEADYTEEMRQLNEEWKENLEIQRQMMIDKAKQAFENAVGWCKTYQWYQGVYERFQKDIEK